MANTIKYLKSDTQRIYSNPAANEFTAPLYNKTLDPTGGMQQGAPAPAAPRSPFASFKLPEYDAERYRTVGDIGELIADSDTGDLAVQYQAYLNGGYAENDANYGVTAEDGMATQSKNAQLSLSVTARRVIDVAKRYSGQNRYVYGKFDCSKFTQEVAGKAGEAIPRTTATQFNYFKTKKRLVGIADAQPGDLIFMGSKASPTNWHVGIYIGNGQMIDNAGRGKPIAVRSIKGRQIKGFGRLSVPTVQQRKLL